jgi:putative methanogenesis marker protein 17
MKIVVESGEEYGNESYTRICNDVLRDVGIKRSIESIYFYGEQEKLLFIFSLRIGMQPKPIRVKDFTEKKGAILNIKEEQFSPNLLRLLWQKYGREGVEQLSRLEIDLKGINFDEISDLVVYDPKEDLKSKIFDAMGRILPEGARIKHLLSSGDVITLIASEDPIKEEWIKRAEEIKERVEKYV